MTKNNLLVGMKAHFRNRRILFLPLRCLLMMVSLMISVFPAITLAQTNDNSKWVGNYLFENMAQTSKRRNTYDVVPGVTYDLAIEENAQGELTATFNENGVQIYQAYQCSVKVTSDKIEFYYVKFVAEGPEDLRKFKPGDLLFSLTAKQIGKVTKYLFQPGVFKIVLYNKAKRGQPIYFKRN